MALAALTKPGPFAERTFELGEFYGVFEGDRLVAMAGERMQAGNLHEVSGICTQPDYQGRGLARRLTLLLVRRQLARGEIPFLHVASSNARARALYERLGFRLDREVPLRIIRKL
jgi:predicted GNAT family acetyltransferase